MRLITLLFILTLTSCTVSKSYTWDNKKVSEKKYNKELKKYTTNYIKNSSTEEIEIFSNMIILYDTSKVKNTIKLW